MGRKKISQMDAHAGTPAAGDLFTMVDVSDLSMAPTGTNKKIRFDAMVPASTGGVERTLWTPGGANDLADWTHAAPGGRRTFGTGVDANGLAALTCTITQAGSATTTWHGNDGVSAVWQSPAVPAAFGDVFRLVYNISWVRTANSLTNPPYLNQSLIADHLLDESCEAIRTDHHFTMAPSGMTIDTANTDAGYNYWSHGWIYQGAGYGQTSSGTMIVTDPDADGLQFSVAAGTIWANAAGVIALSAVHLERVSA